MKDPKYLKWIRSLPCAVSGTEPFGFADIQAHHVILGANRGIGQKVPDTQTIPLRADLHQYLHHVGPKKFWDEVGLDPYEIITELQSKYGSV